MSGQGGQAARAPERLILAVAGGGFACAICGERAADAAAMGRHFVAAHPAVLEAEALSPDEAAAIEAKYFAADGSLRRMPPKEKHKLVALRRVAERFERGRDYSDGEVRAILRAVNEDYALLRRYLVDFVYLRRTADGSAYRRI